jgi:uncharacterized protein (TIGR01777 family)
MIGSDLVPLLMAGGYRVVRLVTGNGAARVDDGTTWLNWVPTAPLDAATLDGVDAVIHLAGENVADGRWNAERKRRILESRTIPTRNIAAALAGRPAERRPKTFICASAVGYYGSRGDELLTEQSPPGTGYFPDVCRAWEDATRTARDAGIRTVNLRIGVVLSPKAGALGKQLFAFKIGLGAVLGSGKQWVPWIGIDDAARAIHHCLATTTVNGPVNIVSPNPVTNRDFTKTLGRVLGRPAFLWLPRFALRILVGELTDEGLLASLRVMPKELLDTGFAFRHPELADALRFVLGRATEPKTERTADGRG